MTTKLKPVEEQVEQYAQSIQDMYFLAGARVSIDTWNNTKDLVRNAIDRHTIYTTLREIVNGIKADSKLSGCDEDKCDEYISRKRTLTLLDELFGVSK